MKQEKENKLHLGKETIQDMNTALDKDQQKMVMGGSLNGQEGITQIPIYC